MRYIFTIVVTIFYAALFAQTNNGSINGAVKDEEGVPLSGALVVLHALNGAVLQQALSDDRGQYRFEKLAFAKYSLNISYAGRKTVKSKVFQVAASAVRFDVELLPDIKEMATVAVTIKRPVIEQQADRMSIGVEGSVITEGNSVLEMLERTPGVTMEGEGNFAIQGRTGARVMIDGKATYLSGSQLALMLRGMQANQVKKVELMSTPSARQDAEGGGGIINIVTTSKRKYEGWKGDAYFRGSHTRKPQAAAGGGIHYNSTKFNAFINGGWGYDENRNEAFGERLFYEEGKVNVRTIQTQINRVNPGRNVNLRGGIELFLDSTSSLSASVSWLKGNYITYGNTFLEMLDADNQLLRTSHTHNAFDEGYHNITYNIFYQKKWKQDKYVLRLNADYAPHGNAYFNEFRAEHKAVNISNEGRKNIQDLSNTTYTTSIDYEMPVGKKSKLEAGWKMTHLDIDNAVLNDILQNRHWVFDSLTSNRFKYNQHVQAGYMTYGTNAGKLSIQAGLRAEYTGIKAHQVTTGSVIKNEYLHLFPSLFLQYPVAPKHKLRVAYSKRIARPDDHHVNVFRVYHDPYNYSEGNPLLSPSLTHAYEFTHSWMNSLFTTVSYSHARNVIMSIVQNKDLNGQTMQRPENVGRFSNAALSMMYSKRITDWWQAGNYANVFFNHYTGSFDNVTLDNKGTSWSANSRHSFSLPKKMRMELIGYYTSGVTTAARRSAPMYGIDMAADKSVWNGKMMMKLGINGLLRNAQPVYAVFLDNFAENGYTRPDNRKLVLTITYRFG